MTETARSQLRELHAQGRQAIQKVDMNRYDAIILELHSAIIQGCHHPVLIDIAMSLRHCLSVSPSAVLQCGTYGGII
ncbi:MAG: FCD domain-containing protein [Gallionellaceae bacterium]|jgi:DNA-binding GntR family transcriptional regulator